MSQALSPLTHETFFKFWACKAFSKISNVKLSAKDLVKARVAAIAFGIVTLGIGTWICKTCLYDRKIVSQSHARRTPTPIQTPAACSLFDSKIQRVNENSVTISYESLEKNFYAKPGTNLPLKKVVEGGIKNIISYLNESNKDFESFRWNYRELKEVMELEGIQNPLLIHELPYPYGIEHLHSLALICDIFMIQDSKNKESELLKIKNYMNENTSLSWHYLFHLMAIHFRPLDFSFIDSNPFEVDPPVMETLYRKALTRTDGSWELATRYFLNREDYWTIKLLPLLLNRKKIRRVVEIILNNKLFSIVNKQLKIIIYSRASSLPISKRIEIVKDVLLPEIKNWANALDSQKWYEPPFRYYEVMEGVKWKTDLEYENKFFSPTIFNISGNPLIPNDVMDDIIRQIGLMDCLKAFLLTSKKHYQQLLPLFCKFAKEETLKLIPLMKLVNAKCKANEILFDGVDQLENKVNSEKSNTPMFWLNLKNQLELLIFDGVVRRGKKSLLIK